MGNLKQIWAMYAHSPPLGFSFRIITIAIHGKRSAFVEFQRPNIPLLKRCFVDRRFATEHVVVDVFIFVPFHHGT